MKACRRRKRLHVPNIRVCYTRVYVMTVDPNKGVPKSGVFSKRHRTSADFAGLFTKQVCCFCYDPHFLGPLVLAPTVVLLASWPLAGSLAVWSRPRGWPVERCGPLRAPCDADRTTTLQCDVLGGTRKHSGIQLLSLFLGDSVF